MFFRVEIFSFGISYDKKKWSSTLSFNWPIDINHRIQGYQIFVWTVCHIFGPDLRFDWNWIDNVNLTPLTGLWSFKFVQTYGFSIKNFLKSRLLSERLRSRAQMWYKVGETNEQQWPMGNSETNEQYFLQIWFFQTY